MKKIIRIFLWTLGSIVSLVLILIIAFFIDFEINGWNIQKRFGNNYTLTSNSSVSYVIVYCKDKACNQSLYVIEDNVIAYNYNKRWIIIKSENNKYWIIDKDIPIESKDSGIKDRAKAGLIGPLDSLEFYKKLDRYDIKLKLKDRR